ncbi:Protein N-acetyltransferase, RimJ/RimL family [Arboricoccus pini]|uniref:Protein N-acetyltransferase, RimJ/RimL family n=1 Tax=Arboricoccus pini TaxID=1963835 RepID=A0A212PVL1_9PROT|nr:GNAT family N-acetyltransferase [Arboricoccus pini]SNB50996.1 Protein N-acetyltransferase, RimJ/RimL family [Arboricoccus pini]
MLIETARLRLRPFSAADSASLAALMADPLVMADLGGPLDRQASDARLERYIKAASEAGTARLAMETLSGSFVGYAGLMPQQAPHPLAGEHDIGWRLVPAAWGQGFATEAARAVVADGFGRLGLQRILAYTAFDNHRSQHVARKLGMRRAPERDFDLKELGVPLAGPAFVWTLERDGMPAR